jgi:hypothetical protein
MISLKNWASDFSYVPKKDDFTMGNQMVTSTFLKCDFFSWSYVFIEIVCD